MDLYSILKFLHVFSAVCWVGGGLCMTVLGVLASSRKDEAEMLHVVQNVAFMANRWFMPASLLTLLFGLATAWYGGLFGQLWIMLGLAGYASAFLTGALVFGPITGRMAKLKDEGRETDAFPLGRKLLQAAKFDYVVMFVVIADMVIKPGPADIASLLVLAAILLGGGLLFLGGLFRPAVATA